MFEPDPYADDAYDKALDMAWDRLYEQAPEGIAWEIVGDSQDWDGAFVFSFREAGGLTFEVTCNPWPDPNWEPD